MEKLYRCMPENFTFTLAYPVRFPENDKVKVQDAFHPSTEKKPL